MALGIPVTPASFARQFWQRFRGRRTAGEPGGGRSHSVSHSMFQSTVQIAGVKDLAEAQMLENLGVDFIGFPLRLGYHKPDTSEDMARTIIVGMKAPQRAVLITYETSPRELSDFCRFLGVSIVQLHGDISSEAVQQLRRERPDLTSSKSLIVRPEFGRDAQPLLAIASGYDPWVDAFITDTFDPRTTACGATGLTHEWAISRLLRQQLTKPLVLAGGLNPTNVYRAIREVGPAAVDSQPREQVESAIASGVPFTLRLADEKEYV